MPFPALSTGNFNKYEKKANLPISNVVVKVRVYVKKVKQ